MRMTSWEESQMTFMIYLNERMTGGDTRFFVDMEQTFLQRPPVCAAERRDGTGIHAFHLARRCRRAQREKVCAAHGYHV
jgi:hypothetical protein